MLLWWFGSKNTACDGFKGKVISGAHYVLFQLSNKEWRNVIEDSLESCHIEDHWTLVFPTSTSTIIWTLLKDKRWTESALNSCWLSHCVNNLMQDSKHSGPLDVGDVFILSKCQHALFFILWVRSLTFELCPRFSPTQPFLNFLLHQPDLEEVSF